MTRTRMLQQSVIGIIPDRLFNTMFHAERMAAESIRSRSPTLGVEELQKPYLMRQMVGSEGIPWNMLRELTALLTSPTSDLRKASRLSTSRLSPAAYSLAIREGRAISLRFGADFAWRFIRALGLDPWLLFNAKRFPVGLRKPFFDDYRNACRQCKHQHFGRRIENQGRTSEEMDTDEFDELSTSIENECFTILISSVEDLHAHLKANVTKMVGKKNPQRRRSRNSVCSDTSVRISLSFV